MSGLRPQCKEPACRGSATANLLLSLLLLFLVQRQVWEIHIEDLSEVLRCIHLVCRHDLHKGDLHKVPSAREPEEKELCAGPSAALAEMTYQADAAQYFREVLDWDLPQPPQH
jgi:hypothetical protein